MVEYEEYVSCISIYIYFFLDTGKIYKLFHKDNKKTFVSSIYSASLDQDVIWSMKHHVSMIIIIIIYKILMKVIGRVSYM